MVFMGKFDTKYTEELLIAINTFHIFTTKQINHNFTILYHTILYYKFTFVIVQVNSLYMFSMRIDIGWKLIWLTLLYKIASRFTTFNTKQLRVTTKPGNYRHESILVLHIGYT